MIPTLRLAFALALSSSTFAQGGVERFCTPGPGGATLEARGSALFSPNAGAGDLELLAQGVPVGTSGLVFYGDRRTNPLPFGNAQRCVGTGSGLFRLPVVQAGGQTTLHTAVDYTMPPQAAGTIAPGSLWSFQAWFRDGAGGSDLTDALEIDFGPAPALPWTVISTAPRSSHPVGQLFEGGTLLILSDPEWQAFWAEHIQGTTPPQIDFSTDAVVATFAGRRLSGGFSMEVIGVSLSVDTLRIESLERRPGTNCGTTFGETQPHQIIAVPRQALQQLGEDVEHVRVIDC